MTTRINSGGPAPGVAPTTTAPRVTPPPARPFRDVVNAGSSAIVQGAEAAVRRLPGGPVLAAAVRPGPTAAGSVTGTGRAEGPTGTAAAGETGELGMEGMLERHADKNLYYLELQERISAESRAYTTLSNVLKARHDTVKNAIGNIR
jgi:hypothetical protein